MPRPVLQAMVLADHAYQDRTTGKVIIAGTFTTIAFGPVQATPGKDSEGDDAVVITGPITRAGSPYLYLALTEVYGQVSLTLKFVDLAESSTLFEAAIVVASTDPVAVAEYILPMPMLPVTKPGSFSLDLFHDNEIIGQWRVNVMHAERQEESAGGDKS